MTVEIRKRDGSLELRLAASDELEGVVLGRFADAAARGQVVSTGKEEEQLVFRIEAK